jgi:hypothetical protein
VRAARVRSAGCVASVSPWITSRGRAGPAVGVHAAGDARPLEADPGARGAVRVRRAIDAAERRVALPRGLAGIGAVGPAQRAASAGAAPWDGLVARHGDRGRRQEREGSQEVLGTSELDLHTGTVSPGVRLVEARWDFLIGLRSPAAHCAGALRAHLAIPGRRCLRMSEMSVPRPDQGPTSTSEICAIGRMRL